MKPPRGCFHLLNIISLFPPFVRVCMCVCAGKAGMFIFHFLHMGGSMCK